MTLTVVSVVTIITSLCSVEVARRYTDVTHREAKLSLYFRALIIFIANFVNGFIGTISGKWKTTDGALGHGLIASLIVIGLTIVLAEMCIDGKKHKVFENSGNESEEGRRERRLSYFLIGFIIIQMICCLVSIGMVERITGY